MKAKPRKRSISPESRVDQSSKASRSSTRRGNCSRANTRQRLLELDKVSSSTEMSQVGDTRLGEVCQPLQPAASTLSRSASLPGSTAPGQRDRPPEGSPPACPAVPQPGYPSNTGQAEASQPKWNEIYSLNPSVDQAEIERWGHKAFHEGSYYYQPLHDLWCKLSTYVNNFISATGPIK